MNIIFFDKKRINELQNLLQDIYGNMLAPAKEAFTNSAMQIDPSLYGIGDVARLINEINNEFNTIDEVFFDNLSFLEILDDKYAGADSRIRRKFERLIEDLALYEGGAETGDVIPDIAVVVNRTLRYIYDNLVQGYEEQVKSISLKGYTPNQDGGYFISDASERNIISKYLTKLDFSFLSSLSHVYDFFDFGEPNLLILCHMRDTTKQNPVKPDEESLKMMIQSQLRSFPELQQILPEDTDNEIKNMPINLVGLAGKENIEADPETGKGLFEDDKDSADDMLSDSTDSSGKAVSTKQDITGDFDTIIGGMAALTAGLTKKTDTEKNVESALEERRIIRDTDKYAEDEGVDAAVDDFSINIKNTANTVNEKPYSNFDDASPLADMAETKYTLTEKLSTGEDTNSSFGNIAEAEATLIDKMSVGKDEKAFLGNISEINAVLTDKYDDGASDGTIFSVKTEAGMATKKLSTGEDEVLSFGNILETEATITEKLSTDRDVDSSVNSAAGTGASLTEKADTVIADGVLFSAETEAGIATKKLSTGEDEVLSFGNIAETEAAITEKLSTERDVDSSVNNATGTGASLTEKADTVTADGVIYSAETEAGIATKKLSTGEDEVLSFGNIAETEAAITEKLSAGGDEDASFGNMSEAKAVLTEKADIGAIDGMILAAVAAVGTVSEKRSQNKDDDTIPDQAAPTAYTKTEGREDTQNESTYENQNLTNIQSLSKTVTEKQEVTLDGDTDLKAVTTKARIIAQKHSINPDGDTELNNISVTEKNITEKTDMDKSAGDPIGDIALLEVSGNTRFGQLNSKNEPERRFRTTKKFRFVDDETEDKTGAIHVSRAAKAARETVKEDEGPEDFQTPFAPTGSRTITPPEFIEGMADELQLLEVAIRKELNWEEVEFYDFLDFVYSLAYKTEFSTSPLMIVEVFAAVIDYIVVTAFKKAEGAIKITGSGSGLVKNINALNYTADTARSAAAESILNDIKDSVIAQALVGMIYPKALISELDIFANEIEVYQNSSRLFESLSGTAVPCLYEETSVPTQLSVYMDDSKKELLEQKIWNVAAISSANAVTSSLVGIDPYQQVTIQSCIPAFTEFEKPPTVNNILTEESENNKNAKSQTRKTKPTEPISENNSQPENFDGETRHTSVSQQNTKEDFNVEYSQSSSNLSEYIIDTAGSATLGFLGGLLLSGEDELDDKFYRLSKLPVHVFEEVVKNAYESGIIQQARKLANMGDIFNALSGGKAIVTTLDNVGSCLIG